MHAQLVFSLTSLTSIIYMYFMQMRAVTMFEGSTVMRFGNWSLPEVVTVKITSPPSDIAIVSDEQVRFTSQIVNDQNILTVGLVVEWSGPSITNSTVQRRKRQTDNTVTMFRVAIGTEPINTFGEVPDDTSVMSLEVR